MVLIEPGFIRTNFANAMVVAKKAQDPASAYSQMTQRIAATSSELAKSRSSADLVAKVILDAVTNPNPNLRYLEGNDVEGWAAFLTRPVSSAKPTFHAMKCLFRLILYSQLC